MEEQYREKKKEIPVFSIVGYSGSGKTTFLEKLLFELKKQKLRTAVLKHDVHGFEIDRPGKDSYRMTKAGALVTGLVSDQQAVLIENRQVSPEELINRITGVDLILTEGYKEGDWPKIMVYRQAAGGMPCLEPGDCLAVVSDVQVEGAKRVFTLENAKEAAEFLKEIVEGAAKGQEEKEQEQQGERAGQMDMDRQERISLEEALRRAETVIGRLEAEAVTLYDSAGRTAAEDICAAMSQPYFPRAAMDGYGVKCRDTIPQQEAGKRKKARLKVVQTLYAGDTMDRALSSGEAVRIMTGAWVPEGADCVIRQEDTRLFLNEEGDREVEICQQGIEGENICPAGEDFQKGELLIEKGRVVDAYGAGALAAAGIQRLFVYRRPRLALIITGDELVCPGQALGPGKIYDANGSYLSARLKELGYEVVQSCVVQDSLDVLCQEVLEACKKADAVLTTGGVSVGEKDLMPKVLRSLGAKLIFHGISIKPGMPTMFSVVGKTPVVSLSGNPYSAGAITELFVRPLLALMEGRKSWKLPKTKGILWNDFPKESPSRRILRGFYDGTGIRILAGQKNGQLKAGIGCNCLVDIPAGSRKLQAGDPVTMLMLW